MNCSFDLTDLITTITSSLAVIFAFLAWRNQVTTRLVVGAYPICLNDNVYFQFPIMQKGELWFSNVGYKAITIMDIRLKVGNESVSLGQLDAEYSKINVQINPGEIKYFQYKRDIVINYISGKKFNENERIRWAVVTNDKKKFVCRTENSIADVCNVNGKTK